MPRGTALLAVLGVLVSACTTGIEAESTMTTTVGVTTTTSVPLPTPDEIMADGVVTDEERELARQAVYECIVDAGADTSFDLYDIDPVVWRDYGGELEDCRWPYTGLYREEEVPGDQFNMGLLGVVECTEDRTGKYYGPKTIDEIGRLTDDSRETIYKAINSDDAVYDECYAELLLAEDREITYAAIAEYRFDNADPKRISLRLTGCGYINGGQLIEETDTSVIVQAIILGDLDQPCWIQHPVRLKDPLGDRAVIDESTGELVPVEAA
jgi:hypothetical protein